MSAIDTDPTEPGLLTSITYHSVTLPRGGGDDFDALAMKLWHERLVEKGQPRKSVTCSTTKGSNWSNRLNAPATFQPAKPEPMSCFTKT